MRWEGESGWLRCRGWGPAMGAGNSRCEKRLGVRVPAADRTNTSNSPARHPPAPQGDTEGTGRGSIHADCRTPAPQPRQPDTCPPLPPGSVEGATSQPLPVTGGFPSAALRPSSLFPCSCRPGVILILQGHPQPGSPRTSSSCVSDASPLFWPICPLLPPLPCPLATGGALSVLPRAQGMRPGSPAHPASASCRRAVTPGPRGPLHHPTCSTSYFYWGRYYIKAFKHHKANSLGIREGSGKQVNDSKKQQQSGEKQVF